MIISNTSLLDTNLLVYAADNSSPFYHAAKVLREKGMRGEMPI